MYILKYKKRDSLLYIEGSSVYISSILGVYKMNLYFLLINEEVLNIWLIKKLLLQKNKLNLIKETNILYNNFKNSLYGSLGKFKIVGLGYKLLFNENQLLFKLGYSHFIYKHVNLRVYIKKKKKKRKFISVGGIGNDIVNNLIKQIQSYRVPNKYCYNGIFDRLDKISFKKKKSLLF